MRSHMGRNDNNKNFQVMKAKGLTVEEGKGPGEADYVCGRWQGCE